MLQQASLLKVEKVEDNLKIFYTISIESNCLSFNNRLTVLHSLQKNILCELHKSHMGIVKMKSLPTSSYSGPQLTKVLNVYIKLVKAVLNINHDHQKLIEVYSIFLEWYGLDYVWILLVYTKINNV